MKRFSFRFQRLLELKQRKEDQQKAELGEVMAIFNRELDQLGGLKQSFDAYRHTSLALPDQCVETSLLGINASYLLRLQREMGEQREHLDRSSRWSRTSRESCWKLPVNVGYMKY